jgi:hypothetical protein
LSGPEGSKNDDLSAIGPPSDLPDNAPDAQSSLETVDLGREGQKADIADRRGATAERRYVVWVALALAVVWPVVAIVFMFLAGYHIGNLHIPDSAWPYLIGSIPGSMIIGALVRLFPGRK